MPLRWLDEHATNGDDNARNSLQIFNEHGVSTLAMTGVAHATSARRLVETLKHENWSITDRIY
jgi:hypothetical protein